MKVSVVITTYDRADLLPGCLAGLQVQDAPAADYEVIVIDNAGQEECQRSVESYGFRYIYEGKTGICYARNRGLEEARAPWVLYFDDDTLLPPDIVRSYISYLPQVAGGAAFGGAFTHWYKSDPPDWLRMEMGVGKFPGSNTSFGVLPESRYLIGCFFGVDVAKAKAAGGFSPGYGMKGKEVGWADETELQFRMRAAGMTVYYAPELVIEHLIQPWKCSFRGRLRYAYSHGKMSWLPTGDNRYSMASFVLDILRITFVVFPVTLLRWVFRHREWYWQNAALIVLTKYAFAYGRLSKRWKVSV
ncbi:glycosyltransferase family 2 protein [Neolewinella aurantiaca]|uniref:Glycosyltransferase family 2 protein n=1 Tax=Neolewinella aurantiaca TaxID=2602767 RepID=A0A5C7FH14_9BACT|nr:glycosyltransferase family 2 protein [Neolewinella aurantiaca]TXF89694.1 glycosyltransferase family 2 protein [Neolewinella aurantiaca]